MADRGLEPNATAGVVRFGIADRGAKLVAGGRMIAGWVHGFGPCSSARSSA
jgi:hypothetical protein